MDDDQNPNDLYYDVIDVLTDARGLVHDLDNKDAGAINDECYLLTNDVEDGIFKHIPAPAEIEEALKPGTHVWVLFTSSCERGRVQERAKTSTNQKQESKEMECPMLVKYDNGS